VNGGGVYTNTDDYQSIVKSCDALLECIQPVPWNREPSRWTTRKKKRERWKRTELLRIALAEQASRSRNLAVMNIKGMPCSTETDLLSAAADKWMRSL
jgi:hypothetical protein